MREGGKHTRMERWNPVFSTTQWLRDEKESEAARRKGCNRAKEVDYRRKDQVSAMALLCISRSLCCDLHQHLRTYRTDS